jgi:hypothetical protein
MNRVSRVADDPEIFFAGVWGGAKAGDGFAPFRPGWCPTEDEDDEAFEWLMEPE